MLCLAKEVGIKFAITEGARASRRNNVNITVLVDLRPTTLEGERHLGLLRKWLKLIGFAGGQELLAPIRNEREAQEDEL